MAFRNKTYVAFDALEQIDIKSSDYRFFAAMQPWVNGRTVEFHYTNSHEKVLASRDARVKSNLEIAIRERLGQSKNFVLILSSKTRKDGSLLSYEIEQAVDVYQLPIIVTYAEYSTVAKPAELNGFWPSALAERIQDKSLKGMHIPFAKEPVLDAIGQFTYINMPPVALNHYTSEAHRKLGCLGSSAIFMNRRKGC